MMAILNLVIHSVQLVPIQNTAVESISPQNIEKTFQVFNRTFIVIQDDVEDSVSVKPPDHQGNSSTNNTRSWTKFWHSVHEHVVQDNVARFLFQLFFVVLLLACIVMPLAACWYDLSDAYEAKFKGSSTLKLKRHHYERI